EQKRDTRSDGHADGQREERAHDGGTGGGRAESLQKRSWGRADLGKGHGHSPRSRASRPIVKQPRIATVATHDELLPKLQQDDDQYGRADPQGHPSQAA